MTNVQLSVGAGLFFAVDLWDGVAHYWHLYRGALTLVLSVLGSGHALLHKRDSRAAVAWVGFIWFVPLHGALLYFILGVNRIRRRAALLRGGMQHYQPAFCPSPCSVEQLSRHLPLEARHLTALAHVVDGVVGRPMFAGNRIEPLLDGDEAYPAMLEAIRSATRSVALSTYIFDRDRAGLAFADALDEARRRQVEVRVLIDATGARYSFPSILRELRKRGLKHARFLPTFPLLQLMSMNLRCHRKLLVVDGRVGFTGGMNIRAGHVLKQSPRLPVKDMHFRVDGPVVVQLQEVFADDWLFTTGEALRGDAWFPPLESHGDVFARGIPDGPDEDLDKLRWSLMGALSVARHSVRVLTPYFLPDAQIIAALNVAAMRGVKVDIVLPAKSNLPFVHWASRALWWQLLERGCRLWLTPPPFDHSKLVLVDDCWALIGSANWDPRSLRLNFEFNVECYDSNLAKALNRIVERKLEQAHGVTLEEVDGRGVAARLRDASARLLTPYL